jgi:hypothetical protein
MIYSSIHGVSEVSLHKPRGQFLKYRVEIRSTNFAGTVTVFLDQSELLMLGDAICATVDSLRTQMIEEATHEAV